MNEEHRARLHGPFNGSLFAGLATFAAWLFAAGIVVGTVRSVARPAAPVPWFDEWSTLIILKAWLQHEASLAAALFAQHNEHRITVPRIVFFADDLFLGGQGRLELFSILIVQGFHAALFLWGLGQAGRSDPGTLRPLAARQGPAVRTVPPGRWAIGGIVVALMFSLAQVENFSSGFQLAFVGVFAFATLAFMAFGRVVACSAEGRPVAGALGLSLAGATFSTFHMANGLLVAALLVALALAARLPFRVGLVYGIGATLLALVYLEGFALADRHQQTLEALHHPVALLRYVATYLGNVLGGQGTAAAAFGALGLAATAAAGIRCLADRAISPTALALTGVMLFVVATALITASGRLDLGVTQALSSRYVSGSVAFWSAQLCYWWVDPPRLGRPFPASWRRAPAVVVVLVVTVLMVAMQRQQEPGKTLLAVQAFARNDAGNLLLVGLDDPAVIGRITWSHESFEDLLPWLRDRKLSVFGGPEAGAVQAPLQQRGTVVDAAGCTGRIDTAEADPRLGTDGVRVSGQGWNGTDGRAFRRIYIADPNGTVVGLASNGRPGAGVRAWSGYAVAPEGETLEAYGSSDGTRLCRLGSAIVVAPVSQASQPEAAP